MGRIVTFRDVVGFIKDKASLSKVAIITKPNALSLRLAVIRATSHSPSAPDDLHVSTLLVLGQSSRAAASPVVTALMDRLRRTGNCVVALKCLLIVHHIITRGPFILQDQISIFPANGGHNYLKLSAFHDGATAGAWILSTWVRWYARYLETLLSTCRVLGYFLGSSSRGFDEENDQELRISSFLNVGLIGDIGSLVVLMEEICNVPDNSLVVEGDTLVKEIMGLLLNDYLASVKEILLRLGELNERLSCLGFADSVELMFVLKRLQECRQRLPALCAVKKPSTEMMWALVQESKDRVGMLKAYKEGGKIPSLRTREKASESARFAARVLRPADSVLSFQSGRFG